MARACQFAKLNRAPKFAVRAPQPLQGVRPRARVTAASSSCAASASGSSRSAGEIPGVIKASW